MAGGASGGEARSALEGTAEDVGLTTSDGGNGLLDAEAAANTTQDMIGEAGTISVDENWTTVTLDGSYTDPVVVTSVGTYNDPDPVHARVRNAGSGSFEVRLEEWAYQDGTHGSEDVNYILLESGKHETSTGVTMFADKIAVSGSEWKKVDFNPGWDEQSYIYSQVMTVNDQTPVTTRVAEFGNASFEIICTEEEANRSQTDRTSDHPNETVGFIATRPQFDNTGDSGESVASTFATEEWLTGSLEDSYSETPVMIQGMQSYFGGDTVDLRGRNQTATSFEVKAQEEQSANNEVNHVREYVATVAVESGPISSP
jgi:hypothetical protein